MMVAPLLFSRRRCVRYARQGCSRAIDIVLHRGRSAHSDRPDNFSVHLDRNPPPHPPTPQNVGVAAKTGRPALVKWEQVVRGPPDTERADVVLALAADRPPAP